MKVKFIYGIISASIVSTLLLMNHVSAVLDWQDEVDVQFTFNPALSVSISEGDIVIPNLGVGTRDNSNEITITVGTNNVAGYQLSATVGNNTTYDTRNLKHDTSATALFSSIDIGSSLAQLTTPSTWGYSTNSGTSYSGLPKYDDTTNVAILNDSDAAGTETTNFLIGAYADQSQLAGDYRNVINFNVVTNIVKTYMQNLDPSLCTTTPSVVYDNRDEEAYTIARLADGKCWMIENLNIAGGTALSADDTDVTSDYISSFTTSNNLTKTGDTIVLPASSTLGFDDQKYSFVYNSGNKTSNCADPGCYSYYSWDAATLGSGRSATVIDFDAPYSICPKGWKLPTTRGGTDSISDYRALMIAYGGSESISRYNADTTPTGATMYSEIGPGTTPNFLLAGSYNDSTFNYGGSLGRYFSATTMWADGARVLFFNADSSIINSAFDNNRSSGESVRCLLR